MNFKDSITRVFYKGAMWCSERSAEICTGVAVVTSVTAVVATVKATKDVIPELEIKTQSIKAIKDSYDKDKEEYLSLEVSEDRESAETVPVSGSEATALYRKDLTKAYASTALVVAKNYALPVILEITAVATIISSNKISRKKNAALAGSLTALQAMYDKYRQNVIDAVGEEKERDIRLGLHKDKLSVESIDENGNKKKSKETVTVMDESKNTDPFTYIFDESSCCWNKSKGVNKDTLFIKQCFWNNRLTVRGYVFVNEILEDLDLPRCEQGQYYGWIYDDSNDSTTQNYITFNISDDTISGRNFLQGYDPSVMITLNPDGFIADKIWPKKPKFIKKAYAGANY